MDYMKRTVKFYGTTVWRSFRTISPDGVQHVVCPIVPLKYKDTRVPYRFQSVLLQYLEDKYLDLIQQTLYREIGQGPS